MNWKRTKIILIFLFLLINLFLYNLLREIDEQHETIERGIIYNTVIAAQKQGIEISTDIIPDKRYRNGEMELFSVSSEHESASSRFLGKNSKLVSFDDTARFYRYENKESVLEISENKLHFWKNRKAQEIKNENDALSRALAALEKFDIKRKEVKIIKNGNENGKSYVLIKPKYKGYDIDGAYLMIYYDGGGITELVGRWFDFVDFSQKSDFLDDVTSVIAALRTQSAESIEIVNVEFSYYVSKELLYGKYISAIPVYTFKKADGNQIIIDARTGENVEK